MNKKKSCYVSSYIAYVILFLVGCIVFFSDHCFATTISEVDHSMTYLKENLPSTNTSYNVVQTYFTSGRIDKLKEKLQNYDISSYNLLSITHVTNSRMVLVFYEIDFDTYYLKFFNGNQNRHYLGILNRSTNALSTVNTFWVNHYTYSSNINDFQVGTGTSQTLNGLTDTYFLLVSPEHEILKLDGTVATVQDINTYINTYYLTTTYNPASITIEPGLNTFHRFQYVGDKQQAIVNLNGYEIDQFYFFIQKYINNEWETITGINDFYELYDEVNDEIYSNPYYIIWRNIEYFDVGTYRYIAVKTSDNQIYATSNSFIITAWEITEQSTGTIDGNGNININTNTGNTVTGITDFLSQDPSVTKDEFENSFPQVEVNDPTDDFFTWFFNQIKTCFTVDTAQYLHFTILNNDFTINSDDYVLDIPVLNNILGFGSGIFIFYAIFVDIRKEIQKLKSGKFTDIAKEDITASMM